MTEQFDPNYTWPGIPPEEQPPNCYRLLGIQTFETTPQVIENAANRQMSHLRTFQVGPQSALSLQLLNKVAFAKICLLDPAKRAEYYRRLRAATKGEGTRLLYRYSHPNRSSLPPLPASQ